MYFLIHKAMKKIIATIPPLVAGSIRRALSACLILLNLFPLLSNAQSPVLLRLQATGNSMFNETVVYFDPAGGFSYNPNYDAVSLGTNPGYLNIVSRFGGIDYQIKCLPQLTQAISVPLKITTGTTAAYVIEITEISGVPEGACLSLHDNLLNTDFDLRSGQYSCIVSDTETVSRFSLNITIQVITATSNIINPGCSSSADGNIIASAAGQGPWNYYWKDANYNIVRTALNKNLPDTLVSLGAGHYLVDINPVGTCANARSVSVLVAQNSPKADFISDTLAPLYYPVSFNNHSQKADIYWWEFGDGMGTDDTNAVHAYTAAGVYTVSLAAYSENCDEWSYIEKTITISGSMAQTNTELSSDILIGQDAGGVFVVFDHAENMPATVNVGDILGRHSAVTSQEIQVIKGKTYLTVNSSGIIWVQVVTAGGNSAIRKLCVLD